MRCALLLLTITALALGAPKSRVRELLRLDGRIVGGEDADIKDYPHQVSLLYFGSHICGGSVLNEKYIVTAGHCTDGASASLLSVRVGTSKLEDSSVEAIPVAKINDHPNFDYAEIDNDVSVLELETPLTLSDTVKPIGLPESGVEPAAGSTVTVTGWGTTSEGAYDLPETLQVVDVIIVARDECADAYSSLSASVTEQMICAGVPEGGKDACQGDSGGPLIQDGILYGLTSWGLGCARAGYPGVYASVGSKSIRDHIKDVTDL